MDICFSGGGAGLKKSIIHRIHYSGALHYQSAQRYMANPARNNWQWRDFLPTTKHLVGQEQAFTQTWIKVHCRPAVC
jgi:hypothetical protein